MRLSRLTVKVDGVEKRRVDFHDGLNLIINRPDSGRTGNSVGKSTVSRVVDFLMLGSISSIYIDEEFQKPNREIEALFTNSDVVASLAFKDRKGRPKEISRSLSLGEKKDQIYCLDDRKVEQREYEAFIQNSMLDIQTKRPSVRSVAPKFIRNNSHRMLNTTRFLDKNASGKDYSELFLYLFGFHNTHLLTEKRDAANLISRRKRNVLSLNAMVKEQKPSSDIKKYKVDAEKLEKKLFKFDYSPEYSNPMEMLANLQSKEDEMANVLLSVERKIDNINRTISLLSKDEGGYLVDQLKAIYEFSGVAVDGALRDLEEVILFHKNLVEKKKHFLSNDIPRLVEEKAGLIANMNSVKEEKIKVFSDIRSKETLEDVTRDLRRLGELKVEIGKVQGLIDQQAKAKKDLELSESALNSILELILVEIDSVYSFEKVFNKHLKRITKQLHDEEYEIDISFQEDTGMCSIEMKNVATNPEGGKKKAEVIAFDFAYICAVSEFSISRPEFVFHDSIEDIDKKQISAIFEISKSLPGQQVLSMLSDKIDVSMYERIEKDVVLTLDENEKFFGV